MKTSNIKILHKPDGRFHRCTHRCPMGYQCTLSADIAHALHICKDWDCGCHSEGRYKREKAMRIAMAKAEIQA